MTYKPHKQILSHLRDCAEGLKKYSETPGLPNYTVEATKKHEKMLRSAHNEIVRLRKALKDKTGKDLVLDVRQAFSVRGLVDPVKIVVDPHSLYYMQANTPKEATEVFSAKGEISENSAIEFSAYGIQISCKL